MAYVWLILGLVLLIVSGEFLVKGAVSLAYKYHISTLVVGMTIVSFGTSAPELLVSVNAALSGHPDISIGNVIGSNIANIALVLGLTALIFPIAVDRNSIRTDWPMMMFSTLLLYLFLADLELVWWEGLIMFCMLLCFIFYLIWSSRRATKMKKADSAEDSVEEVKSPLVRDLVFIIGGCVGLMFGADLLVDGAVDVAKSFGISDLVISATIIAFGTSAPELMTSCVAAFRKHTDISVGNLIGSNIFNIMAIMGITPMVKALEINKEVVQIDMLWVTGIAAITLPILITNRRISRFEGGLLFVVYCSYIYFTVTR